MAPPDEKHSLESRREPSTRGSGTRRRDYDVVLFGAGGFVGRQTVAYFAERAVEHRLRWAIAGPRRETLESARQASGAPADLPLLIADGRDIAAVESLAARSHVVLSTAGPFALYSDALVGACVRSGTHYVDITGETPWVRSLIDRFHQQAATTGTVIVPCCGFDSVPSDLGTLLAVRHLQRQSGAPCHTAKAFFRMSGGLNGGTAATALHLQESGGAERARDPFLLSPGTRSIAPRGGVEDTDRDPTGTHFDADVSGWVGPHVMGSINTRVVRRSALLFEQWGNSYGQDFAYQEYAQYGKGIFARAKAGLVTSGLAVFERMLRRSAGRRLIKPLLPKPSAGPSQKTMDDGWFRCEVIAFTDDERGCRVVLEHRGDPGNRATVRFVCESALCLTANDQSPVETPSPGGVLTPATAFGERLADRLRERGLTITISDIPKR